MHITENQRKWCLKVINHLFKWKLTLFFRNPIDPVADELPDYYEKIKNPMDLEKVKKILLDGNYQSVDDFISDLKLVFENAKTYHGENSVMWFIGEEVLQWLEKMQKSANLSAEQVWYNELVEIQDKIDKHVADMPPSFTYPQTKVNSK
ncbi:Bromodomain containing protein [Tritrichomonas foetus]|uniref:Bromodomain containing protein n=1 Tax=Tritrichomonas foetus TaxID=1144522 RepID=A0A1J4J7X9_9EUKA|nr:Bromodomain containing protein [Tritrichomonas foetus]|eukprot:OHS93525.1 Bromodomain containing protein [Tritrichomonas foetus]